MNDERLQKGLNSVKSTVIYYTMIVVTLAVLIKLLLKQYEFSNYYVESFLFFVSIILLLIKAGFAFDNDERKEELLGRITNIFFSIMLFGAFLIHFIGVAKSQGSKIPNLYFTSTFITSGFIILVFKLKKNNLYLHYKYLNLDNKKYLRNILVRILIFFLVFSLNLLTFYYYQASIIIGAILIGLSFLSLSITYFIFAIYEKNHYDESELLSESKIRNVSKNVAFLLLIPFLFFIVSSLVGNYTNYLIIQGAPIDEIESLSIVRTLLTIIGLDMSLIAILAYIVLYLHLKRLDFNKSVIKLLGIYIISLFIINIFNYFTTFLTPQITIMLNNIELISKYSETINYISLLLSLYIFILVLIMVIKLSIKKIQFINYLYIYLSFVLLTPITQRFSIYYESYIILGLGVIISLIGLPALYIFFKKHEMQIKFLRIVENESSI